MRIPAKKPRVAFGLPYLVIELIYIAVLVVWMERVGHVITKFSPMH